MVYKRLFGFDSKVGVLPYHVIQSRLTRTRCRSPWPTQQNVCPCAANIGFLRRSFLVFALSQIWTQMTFFQVSESCPELLMDCQNSVRLRKSGTVIQFADMCYIRKRHSIENYLDVDLLTWRKLSCNVWVPCACEKGVYAADPILSKKAPPIQSFRRGRKV